MTTYETIRYEEPEARIARIVLARPETRNAQDTTLSLCQPDHALAIMRV